LGMREIAPSSFLMGTNWTIFIDAKMFFSSQCFFLLFTVHPLHLQKRMELRKKEGEIYSIGWLNGANELEKE
jgi:hypothetical protein